MDKIINLPLTKSDIEGLKAGDICLLNGTMYTARDAAHKKLYEMIMNGESLPFPAEDCPETDCCKDSLPDGCVIYYLGPTPARPGKAIGSAGPTTSSRMDKYTPLLLEKGMKGMVGKGRRSEEVRQSIVKNKAIYFVATGGAGALLSHCILSSEVIAFSELGTEAIRRLTVKNFPVTVEIDAAGNDLYKTIG